MNIFFIKSLWENVLSYHFGNLKKNSPKSWKIHIASVFLHRGHLQTMWTVFLGFLTPSPPLWTNMDILGTPLPVHVDFSMTPPWLYFQKKFQTTNLLEF